MNRKRYPSDISREQFETIRGMLEGLRHRMRPRRVDLYDIFCAILYLLKNACIWQALPSDFPSVSTVRYYFDLWGKTRISVKNALQSRQRVFFVSACGSGPPYQITLSPALPAIFLLAPQEAKAHERAISHSWQPNLICKLSDLTCALFSSNSIV